MLIIRTEDPPLEMAPPVRFFSIEIENELTEAERARVEAATTFESLNLRQVQRVVVARDEKAALGDSSAAQR